MRPSRPARGEQTLSRELPLLSRRSEDHRRSEHRRGDLRSVCRFAARRPADHCTAGRLHKRCVSYARHWSKHLITYTLKAAIAP